MSTALQPSSRWRVIFTGARDVVTTGLALYGVWNQEHTGHVHPWLLLVYAVILSLIPASHAWALARATLPAGLTPSPDTEPAPQSPTA